MAAPRSHGPRLASVTMRGLPRGAEDRKRYNRLRRRQQQYCGNGLAEKANDRIVVRRQKRRGMQWSVASSDGLAALRTLLLNEGWESSWREGRLKRLAA